MTRQERITLLVEAQEELEEVINKIKQAVEGTSTEQHTNAYLISHLDSWRDTSNYLSSDEGINNIIDGFENDDIKIFDEE